MKKALKILLPIIVIVITLLFIFKNDLMLWSVINKYKTDPSLIYARSDIPEAICADAQEEILNAYLAKPDTSVRSLAATVKLIEFFRTCSSEPSTKDKKPLNKKSFDVLMDIYRQTENENIRESIAYFLKKEDINAFYKYFEITQRDGLLFYDDNFYSPVKHPKLVSEFDKVERELWCKNVQPKVEAAFIALLESDTLSDPMGRLQLLKMYENTDCGKDRLHLRKIQFAAWSKLIAKIEEEFYSSQPPGKVIDLFELRLLVDNMNDTARNELEATSFVAILSTYHVPEELELEKNLLLYFLDYPIESKIMCNKMVWQICHEYGRSMDKEVMKKAKIWLQLVDEKYPELSIEEYWGHQMLMAR